MKYLTLIATAAAVLFPGTALAQDPNQPVLVVAKPTTMAQWSKAMTKGINKRLYYPAPNFGQRMDVGFVSVTFQCSESGRPVAVALYRKSGSRSLDRAAMYAVNSLSTLHPMPAMFRPNQKFVANILFATDQEEYDRQLIRLNAAADAQNSKLLGVDRPIALNVSFGAGAG